MNPRLSQCTPLACRRPSGTTSPRLLPRPGRTGKIPKGKYVIHANTPSYVGSHVTGFANMVKGMVDYFAAGDGHKENRINIIPGYVEPADMEEIKRISRELGVSTIMFPDTSNVLNAPQTGRYAMYPSGGVTVADLILTGSSIGTVALGRLASGLAARALDTKCKVPCEILDLPIGRRARTGLSIV